MKKPHLDFVINNVFFPPKLPSGSDNANVAFDNDRILCELVAETAQEYSGFGRATGKEPLCSCPNRWLPIIRMLNDLAQSQPYPLASALLQRIVNMPQGGKYYRAVCTTNA